MRNKKDLIQIILLGAITIILFAGLVLTAIHFKKTESQKNSPTINEKQERKEDNKTQDKEEKNSQENGSNSNSNLNKETPKPTQNTESGNNSNQSQSPTQTPVPEAIQDEASVVSFFENLDISVATYQDENNPSFREKAKNAFTTVIDFLFYDSAIHGITFKELTTSAKLKVLKIALKIDHKIDSYFPNYKTTIKTKMQNLKGKVALLYLETTAKLCESVGESACNEARQDFKNMKESFGFTWDIIKSAASSSYSSLKTILNEWYQSIK